jgi:hypothetical protein
LGRLKAYRAFKIEMLNPPLFYEAPQVLFVQGKPIRDLLERKEALEGHTSIKARELGQPRHGNGCWSVSSQTAEETKIFFRGYRVFSNPLK